MSACPRCGTDNVEGARFCSSCGFGLERAAAERPLLVVRKTVTVLFSDVKGSTALSERMDPERMRRVMTLYFDQARATLEWHGGKVEKFIGDAVMAVFGVPTLHEDDALRALRAAGELRQAIEELSDRLEHSHGTRIEIRIGVNSGEVIAGDPTGDSSFVSGEVVAVAERLQGSAAPGEILIGEETYRLARDAIHAEPLEPLVLKGKRDRVMAYRLVEVVPGAPAVARRFDSPMVGRTRELALLESAFSRAVLEQSCHLFTVLGPAGVGKSRLVAAALAEIGERARVLSGSCLPYGEGITFWPVLQIVKQLTGIAEGDPPAEAQKKIEQVLPGEPNAEIVAARVSELIGLAENGAAGDEGFWGVRHLLEALARQQPLVVVFDDLNWAEQTLLDLVEHIADWSRDSSILLVAVGRRDLLDTRPAWSGGKHNATAIFLEPLSERESERLVEGLLGGGTVDAKAIARIQAAAEGNPLFVEEMISMLIDDGLLGWDDGAWAAKGDLSHVRVPSTIQALVAARLDRLEGDERHVIARAAVEGKIFHQSSVRALAEGPARERVGTSLLSLVRKDLIRPDTALFTGEDGFGFRHVLFREVAYDSIPKQLRAELHERFAEWLEEREAATEYDELMGYHLEQAVLYREEVGPLDESREELARRAEQLLASAGRRALSRGDGPAAASLLDRALRLATPESPNGLELRYDVGVAKRASGDLTGADAALSHALDEAHLAGNRLLEARVLLERASLRSYTKGEDDELILIAQQAIPVFAELGDELGLAMAWNLIAFAHFVRCSYREMEEVAERAAAHARNGGSAHEEAESLRWLAVALALGPTPAKEAIARCEEILVRVEPHQALAAVITATLARLYAMCGRFDRAHELYARSKALATEFGAQFTLARLPLYSGPVELIEGDMTGAERELRTSYELLETIGEQGALSTVTALLARCLVVQGRTAEAASLTDVSERTATPEDAYSEVVWRGSRARVVASDGRLELADTLARQAVQLAEQTDGPNLQADALVDLADVLGRARGPAATVSPLRRAEALYAAKGNVVGVAEARRLLDALDPLPETR
jgi:class 3 adenylate cyclase/tetratricopeptide (TPR) repeat protein